MSVSVSVSVSAVSVPVLVAIIVVVPYLMTNKTITTTLLTQSTPSTATNTVGGGPSFGPSAMHRPIMIRLIAEVMHPSIWGLTCMPWRWWVVVGISGVSRDDRVDGFVKVVCIGGLVGVVVRIAAAESAAFGFANWWVLWLTRCS